MDVLIRYGFTIEEIKNMIDSNPEINYIKDENIYSLIDLLEYNKCHANQIKNIFICNPFCLSLNVDVIKKLIEKLKKMGLNNLNIIFDSNPFILNLSVDDIMSIWDSLIKKGLSKNDIIENFKYNSFELM